MRLTFEAQDLRAGWGRYRPPLARTSSIGTLNCLEATWPWSRTDPLSRTLVDGAEDIVHTTHMSSYIEQNIEVGDAALVLSEKADRGWER